MDSASLVSENFRPDTETPTPCIILESATESKMEAATEVMRESSPRTSSRPKLMRQSSVEMQQAVDVQRPLNTERKKSTSLCIPVDTHTRAGSTEEVELEIELTSEQVDCEARTNTDTFGGLSTDTITDTWKNSAKENSDDDAQEDEPQLLSLEAPSYSRIASQPKPTVFEDEIFLNLQQ